MPCSTYVKDWWDLGPGGSTYTWPRDGVAESPFKAPLAALLTLPGCGTPFFVQPDPAHTYAIAGWGKDMAASTLVILMRLRIYSRGSFQDRFDDLFGRFKEYCKRHGKTTSLTGFSLKVMKVTTSFGFSNIAI